MASHVSQNYKDVFFNSYFEDDGVVDYFKVHEGNQSYYKENYTVFLPKDKGARILDIGCGAGQFLFFLKALGYENIEGCDIGEKQIRLVTDMGIKGTVISNINEFLNRKTNYYDFIFMGQVIEHLRKEELILELRNIFNSMKEGGVFLFSTPNMCCISGLYQRYIDITHEIGFTERSVHQLMQIVGFKKIHVLGDRIGLNLRPKRLIWSLLNRLWYSMLGFIYYVEKGMDRPKVISRHLVVVCEK
jgi:2-polyprenyl-3-methyl-5-hydroxy-6-metoxy-1,4-benzoquinol methylase